MAYIKNLLKRIWSFFFGSAEETAVVAVPEESIREVSLSEQDKANRRRKGDRRRSNYRWLRFFNIADKNSASASQIALAKAHFGNFRPIQPFRVNHRSVRSK